MYDERFCWALSKWASNFVVSIDVVGSTGVHYDLVWRRDRTGSIRRVSIDIQPDNLVWFHARMLRDRNNGDWKLIEMNGREVDVDTYM